MKDISTTYYTANDQNCSTVNDREIGQSELENNAIAHSYMDAIYLYGHMLHQTGYQQTNASLFLNEFRNQTIEYEKENKTIIMDINGDQASKLVLFCANKDGSWHVCLVGVSFPLGITVGSSLFHAFSTSSFSSLPITLTLEFSILPIFHANDK